MLKRYFHFFKIPEKKKEYYARKLVGFSNEQMFKVVSDVRSYKKFLPFCTRSKILAKYGDEVHANLEIGFPPIVENYTSIVTLKKNSLVRAVCRDGRLFNYLETTWHFSPGLRSNPKSCIIDFYINFEFKSFVHSKLASMFFDRLCDQMEMAFIEEAKKRFGPESMPIHTLEVVSQNSKTKS